MKIEHIDNLSRWKKSWSNIWSRLTPHRLKNYEKIKYELALKNNYLEIDVKDRVNLLNLWEKVCMIKKIDNIVLHKNILDWKILKNWKIVFFWNIKEAKLKIKKISWKHI